MKKFAKGLCLEYTEFGNLSHLVASAMRFALTDMSTGCCEVSIAEIAAWATAFCDLQDKRLDEEKIND